MQGVGLRVEGFLAGRGFNATAPKVVAVVMLPSRLGSGI